MEWNAAWTVIAGLAGGLLLSELFGAQQQAPAAPQPILPPAAQDPSATPDYNKLLAANSKGAGRSGPSAGPSSTFKTGPGGIDPAALSLGTNTLLGA